MDEKARKDLVDRLAPTMVWDSAAGQALSEAAGGVVLRPDGIRLPYLAELKNEGFVAACTISLAERVLMLIRSLRNTGLPD
ncbi:inositol monophosphatase family protein [Sinorhizobium fredii]|uniref:inositol monophosphatase family protein n=1 Tax=Rhizobium fredii TaxID=380 RepID=UPI0005B3A652|nr:inositol monophosphatase family protein [Sinorhizobium fredii]